MPRRSQSNPLKALKPATRRGGRKGGRTRTRSRSRTRTRSHS